MVDETIVSPDNESSSIEIPTSYQQLPSQDDDVENLIPTDASRYAARQTLLNFAMMSILFSANHGCVSACLGLATARLGATGAWQSGLLFLTYTLSAILGATWIVKKLGARNALWLGMTLYCVYVGCFWVATRYDDMEEQRFAAYTGAAIGGIGAGFLWTSQGAYFGQAAEEHAAYMQQDVSISTSYLAGVFAFFYLAEELLLRLLSTLLVGILSWESIFGVYTVVAVGSSFAMPIVRNYQSNNDGTGRTTSAFYKITVAGQLLWRDPKMKYMIGLNAVFGFASAFLNSYVNGQVVPVALKDPDGRYIGILSSWVSALAAGLSLIFGQLSPLIGGKGPILLLGSICFVGVVVPFVIEPRAEKYGWGLLLLVYTFHGIGRATFEGTLKATFADYFPYEKEGAFANIILQNGLASAIGYAMTFGLVCEERSRYCIQYSNGTLHDVLTFEVIVITAGAFAIMGYLRASALFKAQQDATYTNVGAEQEGDEPMFVSIASTEDASYYAERRDMPMTQQ